MDTLLKNIFIDGAISATFIAEAIDKHSLKTGIGGHSIFLGQVRADLLDEKTVTAIEYTCNTAMALAQVHRIREDIISKHSLTCMHVYHSLGTIIAGQICLFVFTSAPHRAAAINACEETVELIKQDLPIWGKEIFNDESYQWKENV